MSLRLLSARIVRSSAPLNKAASLSIFRGYAIKKFSRDHEWVFVDGNIGTVGVTEHAQQTLGDIVFVELPEVGTDVSVGESCGVVESVKAVADVLSPVSGQVKEVNDALIEESSLVNDSPEAEGWIYRIELSDEKELDNLMDKDHYTKFCEEN